MIEMVMSWSHTCQPSGFSSEQRGERRLLGSDPHSSTATRGLNACLQGSIEDAGQGRVLAPRLVLELSEQIVIDAHRASHDGIIASACGMSTHQQLSAVRVP